MEDLSFLSSIIVGAMTLTGVIITSVVQSKGNKNEQSIREQKVNDRLEAIEKKLDIHNGYAEKFGEIEKSIVSIQKDIEYIKKMK